MSDQATAQSRSYTPAEIAELVRSHREALGWKQIALAGAAHIDERTVQRVEAGHKVGVGTLQNIARALKLGPDHFTKRRVLQTPEEVEREAEDFRRKSTTVEVSRASSGQALMDVLQGSDACSFHIPGEFPAEVREASARLFDYLRDAIDIWPNVPFSQRYEYQEEMTGIVHEIEEAGCVVCVGSREARFKPPHPDGKPYSMALGYAVVAEKGQTPEALVVPRGVRFV